LCGIEDVDDATDDGLTLAKDGTLYGKRLCESKSIEKFLSGVEGIITNSAIPGDERNPARLSMLYDPKEKILGQLTLEIAEADVVKWKLTLKKMRQEEDFTREHIISFQSDVDEFSQLRMQLYGHLGVTNYIHMMMPGQLL
jgi:hypothetical protein